MVRYNRILTYCSSGILPTPHQDRPVSSTSVVRAQANIRAQHRSSFPKQVFEVLPSDAIWQLSSALPFTDDPSPLVTSILTFPTNRFTRPSVPTAEGKRLVIKGVTDLSISGTDGAGGALAMAAAMTASISADVGALPAEYGR